MSRHLIVAFATLLSACSLTSHEVTTATLGTPRTTADLVASLSKPGIIELETVASADWAVDRSGLINLDSPIAKEAGLVDGDEAINVFFHVLRHPTQGTFLVDTGVETALRDAPEKSAMSSLVRSVMHLEKLKVNVPLGEWVAANGKPAGVFLTHLHLDHVTGMADVPKGTPLFTGPGEGHATSFENLFVRGSTDQALAGQSALQEWAFTAEANGAFDAVLDIFGDGSVWALSVPGHTPGSTAYLVNSTRGPVLLTGDACHTRWGWEHHVEPGTFTGNAPRGRVSFEKLQAFVEAHPEIEVRFGHQR